jgi:DNA-binding beta-propeller fold protein YncE
LRRHAKASSAGSTEGSGNSRGLFRRAVVTRGASSEANGSGARSLRLLSLMALMIGLLVALSAPSQSLAFDQYQGFGQELPGTTLNGPTKAAVDAATGNVLVVNSVSDEIQVYGPGGASSPGLVSSFGATELSSPYGIAIDQNNGDVYISDADNNRIARYSTDDAVPPTYTLDATYTGPAQGANANAGQVGSFKSAIAIDPANGDLLVADDGNKYVERFDSSGAFVDAFDGSSAAGGPFQNLLDIVVGDDGVTYVLDSTGTFDPGPRVMSGVSRVERFDIAGVSLGAIQDNRLSGANSITFGDQTGSLFVADQGGGFGSILRVYRDGVQYQELAYGSRFFSQGEFEAIGLAVDEGSPAASGRVYGVLEKSGKFAPYGPGIELFELKQLPDVSIDLPSAIEPRSAHLSGSFDPIHGTASSTFEYSDADGSWAQVPTINGTATSPSIGHPEADLTGLNPNTTYRVRLVVTNDDGPNTSDVRTFITSAEKPEVGGASATELAPTSAVLHATVSPLGSPTTFHFEYGTTTSYSLRAPAASERAAGEGQNAYTTTQFIDGLQPETTYHFRIVAQNAAGISVGADHTFTTLAADNGRRRAYELVSLAEKGGANVKRELGMQASADGNAFAFVSSSNLGPSESGPFYPRYVAHRTATDWETRATDPPQLSGIPTLKLTAGISDDGTKAVVLSQKALAPGAIEGGSNVYLLDVRSGTYTTMASTPTVSLFVDETYTFTNVFVQGTSNFDHVLLLAKGASLLPGVPNGALYDFTGGQLHIVSLAPDDSPLTAREVLTRDHDRVVVSPDGSRIVFSEEQSTHPNPVVYLRSDGVTRALSESRRSSDAGTLQKGIYVGGDRNLDQLYLASRDLTDDSEPGIWTLYRYTVASDSLERLTKVSDDPIANDFGYQQVSSDGGSAFFISAAVLNAEAAAAVSADPSRANFVYVWHQGALLLVAALDRSRESGSGALYSYWASPNGRYFAFSSLTNLTGYEATNTAACSDSVLGQSGQCREIYRYDTETKDLICVSCRSDGKPPTGAYIGPDRSDVGTHSFIRAVDNAGEVFFHTPDPLVQQDVNSTIDVYEYDGDGLRLLSSGRGTDSRLGEVSADGSDVFFTTKDRLVGIDKDAATDVYDARDGGGLASQNPPPPREECIRDDCKAAPNGGPELPFGGSEGLSGPENVTGAPKKRCGKGRHARKVKGKQRCVKQTKTKKNRTNDNRRQGR